jgi:hypothetical protein
MAFSIEVFAVVAVTFLGSYYLGWIARGKWDKNKNKFFAEVKKLRKENKELKAKKN